MKIEDYKGQEIHYDEDTDKFTCNISIEDKTKSTKRQSLKDVRNEIDQFIKLNLDFKPFTAIFTDPYGRHWKAREVKAIRKDGSFVVGSEFRDELMSMKEMNERCKIYDHSAIEDQQIADEELERAQKVHTDKSREILRRLKNMDLSRYQL